MNTCRHEDEDADDPSYFLLKVASISKSNQGRAEALIAGREVAVAIARAGGGSLGPSDDLA